VLVRDIYNNKNVLLQAGVKETRLKTVHDEAIKLCN
jgi:hypothetical protein